jgi:hypothetical protein
MQEMEQQRRDRRPRRIGTLLVLLAVAVTVGWLVARDHHGAAGPASVPPAAAAPDADGRLARAKTQAAIDAGVARGPSRQVRALPQPGPLPPPDAPLSQTYHTLKARADAGDGAAAARFYHDVRGCFSARVKLGTLATRISLVADPAIFPAGTKPSAKQQQERDQHLADLRQELDAAKRIAAQCDGLNEEQLRLAPAALTAARLGDKAASDCYISGMPLFVGGILDHPEWLVQYKDNALAIANNALAAGDWSVVGELQRAYAPTGFHFGPLADLTGIDPVMNYRLLRLQRLGATNEQAAQSLDRMIAAVVQDLSGNAIGEGDAWAQDTFAKYFSSVPPDSGGQEMGCASD